MKKIVYSALFSSMVTSTLNAAVIDIDAGIGIWQPTLTGSMKYGTNTISSTIVLDDDLDIKDTHGDFDNNYVYIDLDHFLPIIPNARVERLNYSTTSSAILKTNVKFGNVDFSQNQAVITEVDMVQTDLIAYWSVPLLSTVTAGILDIDYGLMVKKIDGYYAIYDKNNPSYGDKVDLNKNIPMGYLAAKVDLPALPVSFEATHKVISYKDSQISDSSLKMSLTLPIPIPLIDTKIDFGYRKQIFKIDDSLISSFNSDIEAKGIFFGMSAKF